MQAISVQQPWAFAIARGGKSVSNQGAPTAYRGPLLIHASMRVDLSACDSPLVQAAGWDPRDPLAAIGAAIAVADLAAVCSATVDGGTDGCACGPWAEPGMHHWHLADVRALPRPIVALGRTDLWEPSASLVAEVETMLTTAAANQAG
ncbi:ASCH domain-containing protein [Actinomadura sediminis]|uniref:ASCH domain-containing protein n=1 Tax=Actinomadura sediminis TaxID=1038904 RepID=A0ABW3EJL7_9ACTN